jgi:hypothetical protein
MYEQLTFDSVMKGFCGRRELKIWCCPDCGNWFEPDVRFHKCLSGYIIFQEGLRTITPEDNDGIWKYYLAKLGLDLNGQRL